MYGKIKEHLQHELAEIEAAGLYKRERIIASPQRAEIEVAGRKVLNFCANNYLGLSDNPRLIEAAKKAMDARGYGMSSVRFICGCQDIHKELEKVIADYFGTEDTILYAACFDANGGVFEPLFTDEDAIISDSLNHASIIDGVRLCKAKRHSRPFGLFASCGRACRTGEKVTACVRCRFSKGGKEAYKREKYTCSQYPKPA